MQKILIVDDEPIARNSLKYIIEKNIPELEIVGMCASGKDAIAKNYEFRPDIIIMDINMPGINGIDAMKQIRMTNEDVAFIIVSAYDYFDYAMEAVSLYASEYFLNPVSPEKLVESLKKVMLKIEQRQLDMLHQLEQRERMNMIMPILETGFINAICLYDSKPEELEEYCQLFEYKQTGGFVMIIEFLGIDKVDAQVKGNAIHNKYRDILKGICDCIVGPIMSNRMVIYINAYCGEDAYEQKQRSIDVAEKVIRRTAHIFEDIRIGIGSYNNDLESAKKSYIEAARTLRIARKISISYDDPKTRIYHADDYLNKSDMENDTYEQLFESNVYECMKSEDIMMARIGFEQVFRKMVSDPKMDYLSIKNAIIGFIVILSKKWYSFTGDYYNVMMEILNANDEEELFACASAYLNDVIIKINNDKQSREQVIVRIAMDYIEKHYQEEITLEDVAKQVGLSSNYFSRLFKSQTGTNFSDKILSFRMEKAKEILRDTDYNIKDITYMVGYVDPNYFTKLFKKYTGKNASEYRKLMHEKREEGVVKA